MVKYRKQRYLYIQDGYCTRVAKLKIVFLNNSLSLTQLDKAMRFGNLDYQIAIRSKKAFSRIVFKDYMEVDREIYYSKYLKRDKEAREALKEISLDLS